ncbi:ATP-dependent 5'-3' DNA helicase HCS1 [Kluyveromyces lactis]|uniref:DNA helicase n=1 Tax=Kluyveromyces lactis (strain ATCC 8585 / CBS 2359 / DSM 70799 / NBRC 1267 / NRRL Y-1140 / WM37) TaxID=284590 RepID=Q6CMS3_KLULA|nr:uncharacterized protein KLLA0_E18085g [Kluyveromyces lactis]CAG99853.1 KLLA0E18085p [Kluyveromyces lactis]|eukprot:XP_454766.1 uncharacterized protein KLLA0_E18085g [Kluyveromyces lactis]
MVCESGDCSVNKQVAEKFLDGISHEQQQDVEQTSKLLASAPLPKLIAAGLAINHLQLDNIRTGIGSKLYLELSADPAITKELNTGSFKVGDIVLVQPSAKAKSKKDETVNLDAVVSKVSNNQIVLAVDESKDQDAVQLYSFNRLCLLKTTNTITYKRMQSTMRKLAEFNSIPDNILIQYMLHERKFIKKDPEHNVKFYNEQLNESQRDAIQHSLSNEISIIHGPPGTGKTYTLVELIKQLYDRGERILVCGPSNISVDTILERLSKVVPGDELLRIGHPSRLLPQVLSHSLDVLSKKGDSGMILKDIMKEIDDTIASVKKLKSSRDRKKGWQEVKALRKELRQREKSGLINIILKSKIVVCTLHGSSSRELLSAYDLQSKLFNTLIIDEVSQSLEPQCWIPLISHLKSDMQRLIIAGDDKQLPPTIKTEDNDKVKRLLSTTVFDRLLQHYGNEFKYLLNVQYRMNEEIMQFSSNELYDGKLKADDSVAKQLLADLPGVESNDNTTFPCIWLDTEGDDFPERSDENDNDADDKFHLVSSKYNENEAYLALYHVEQLIKAGVTEESIGVISPYNSQVSLLKKLIHEKHQAIEISTVDGFQGREKECIILSLVRSNENFEVGFLKDERRLNVAMTRPKRQLCVIGNMEMLSRCRVPFLNRWVLWVESGFEVIYPDPSIIHSLYT